MAFAFLLAAGALWIVFNRIVRSLGEMTAAMSEIAEGNTSVAVPCVARRDEMGAMARALLIFKENAERVQSMQAEREALERAACAEKAAAMNRLADNFEAKVGEIVDKVSSASHRTRSLCQDTLCNGRPIAATDHEGGGRLGAGLRQYAVGCIRHRGADILCDRDQPPGAGIRAD